jgi:hypothetical protein
MSFAPLLRALAAASLVTLSGAGQAAIVEGADVGGFRTFVDTTTGTVWADLDNHLHFTGTGFVFRFIDYNDYLNALTAAGFTWAFVGQVNALTATLPLSTTAEYNDLGALMGTLSFGETTTLSGYSNATDGLVARQYGAVDYGLNTASWATNGPMQTPVSLNDPGLWAFLAAPPVAGTVPVPGSLALAGLGLCALVGRRRGARVAPSAGQGR